MNSHVPSLPTGVPVSFCCIIIILFCYVFTDLFYSPCSEREDDCIHSLLIDLPSDKVKINDC